MGSLSALFIGIITGGIISLNFQKLLTIEYLNQFKKKLNFTGKDPCLGSSGLYSKYSLSSTSGTSVSSLSDFLNEIVVTSVGKSMAVSSPSEDDLADLTIDFLKRGVGISSASESDSVVVDLCSVSGSSGLGVRRFFWGFLRGLTSVGWSRISCSDVLIASGSSDFLCFLTFSFFFYPWQK